jgi:hypothetical protein
MGSAYQKDASTWAHLYLLTRQSVQRIGRHRWLTTSYGAFAGVLPGFIIGYYTTSHLHWTAAPGVYSWVGLCCAGSYLATTVVVRSLNLTRPVSLALLVASSVALYYWWAAPLIAESLYVPAACAFLGRGPALALVAFWLVRAWPLLQAERRQVSPVLGLHARLK